MLGREQQEQGRNPSMPRPETHRDLDQGVDRLDGCVKGTGAHARACPCDSIWTAHAHCRSRQAHCATNNLHKVLALRTSTRTCRHIEKEASKAGNDVQARSLGMIFDGLSCSSPGGLRDSTSPASDWPRPQAGPRCPHQSHSSCHLLRPARCSLSAPGSTQLHQSPFTKNVAPPLLLPA